MPEMWACAHELALNLSEPGYRICQLRWSSSPYNTVKGGVSKVVFNYSETAPLILYARLAEKLQKCTFPL